MVNLGGMHNEGRGTPKNVAEAFRWMHMAATQGHRIAQWGIGTMIWEW